MDSHRKTRVVATIGPASDTPEHIEKLLDAGVDVFRISTAHDTVDKVVHNIHTVRTVIGQHPHVAAIMVDLAGPKLRFAAADHPITVTAGSTWTLRTGDTHDLDTFELASTVPEGAWQHLEPGTTIRVGDGHLAFTVTHTGIDHVTVTASNDATVRGRPGLHIPSDLVPISAPTDRDLVVLEAAIDAGIDMVAASFVKTSDDLTAVSAHLNGQLLIAKIETAAAVRNLTSIIETSDAVMVARGDLGLEFPISELPFLQKAIIAAATASGKPAITATQMLESMIHTAAPTRAEASDIVTAVLDGSSAVMLSGETAVGANPTQAVATMATIAGRADQAINPNDTLPLPHVANSPISADITHAVSHAAIRLAEEVNADAIVCLTERGFTARALSRWRPRTPIVAVTSTAEVARQLALSWGVTPVAADIDNLDAALHHLVDDGTLPAGATIVAVTGPPGARATDTVGVRKTPR